LVEAQGKEPIDFFVPNLIGGFQDKFSRSQKRNRWCFCGNRSGKSELSAAEVVRFATGKHPHRKIETPNIGWVISPDANLSREIMEPKIRRLLGEHHISRWRERERIMEVDNGSEIFFKSADSGVTKFTGRAIRYGALDEDIPQDIYGETLMRTLDEEGDIWGTLTPIHSSWMYDAIFLNSYSDLEIECFFGATSENSNNINKREIDRIRGSFSVDEMDARLEGKFIKFAGLIYKEFNDNIHLLQPFHVPDVWPRYRFIDHGLNDPEACIWLAISPDEEYHIYREYYCRNRTIQDNCKAIKEMSGRERYVRTYIDPQTNTRSAQAHFKTDFRVYIDCGISPLTPWPKTAIQTKINAAITRLNNRKIFIHRGLPNTIKEFKNWGREKSGEPEKRNDHTLDCIGAACLINPKFYTHQDAGSGSEIPIDCLSDSQVNF